MNKSNTIKSLAEALAKAQAEMPSVKMNASNPFLKNKFADLGAVIETSRPTLAKHGLSISQFPTSETDRIGVTSTLMHISGEWLEDVIYLPLSDEKGKSAAQVAGSVITYLRRYSWAAMLGLYADEDTDGHNGNGQKKDEKKEPERKSVTATNKTTWSVAQKEALIAAELAKDDFSAKGMLGLSNLPGEATASEIVTWGKTYRERRTANNPDTGKKYSAPEAAEYANSKMFAEVAA